jgi:hypothetical protein
MIFENIRPSKIFFKITYAHIGFSKFQEGGKALKFL